MNDLPVEGPVQAFKVGNFQSGDGLDRLDQRFISLAILSEGLSHASQNPEDLRPIEPLPVAMIAEAHTSTIFTREGLLSPAARQVAHTVHWTTRISR